MQAPVADRGNIIFSVPLEYCQLLSLPIMAQIDFFVEITLPFFFFQIMSKQCYVSVFSLTNCVVPFFCFYSGNYFYTAQLNNLFFLFSCQIIAPYTSSEANLPPEAFKPC